MHPNLLPFGSFPQTYIRLTHENSISEKSCQFPQYSTLKNRFSFNPPIPRFRPRFHDRGNHRALLTLETTPVAPILLCNILYMSKKWPQPNAKGNILLQNTIRVWRLARKLEGQEGFISHLIPIHLNRDFCPGLIDHAFSSWSSKGIVTVVHLLIDDVVVSEREI